MLKCYPGIASFVHINENGVFVVVPMYNTFVAASPNLESVWHYGIGRGVSNVFNNNGRIAWDVTYSIFMH